MTPTYEQKLAMLAENKDFAIFNELSSLNDLAKDIIKAVESSKTAVVSVDNLSDAIVDLSPLQANFEALKGSVEAVTKAIQAIPDDKEMDMSGVEKLLKQIASKEMDMSHMMAMTKILDDILFAVQTTASHSDDNDEVLAPDLKKIQEILNLLNENVVAIEIPGFDYDKLAKIIKDNLAISVSAGGVGGKTYVRRASDGEFINPATEESLSQLAMAVANSLSATTYDLNAAAYSGSTSITNDYILDSIALDFSTAISKTITITTAQGTKLYEATNSLTNLVIPFNQSFNGTENITVAVTQTAGACTMDLRLKTSSGSNTLVGNPTVNQGTSPWVTSSPDVVALMPTALGQGTMAQSMKVVVASDQSTLIVRDDVHSRVHNGQFFSGGYYNAALADAGTIRLLVQTGATHVTHMDFDGAASGYTTVHLYEGATFSAAGTAVTMSNHNRNSANVFPGTVTHTPTITDVGTQINGTAFVPGGTKGAGSGADFGGFGREFNLLPSTTYLLDITNVSGGAEQISIHLNTYFPTL